MTALGVSRATVIEDYQLTNRYLDRAALTAQGNVPNPANPLAGLPSRATNAMMAADPAYLRAALAVVDAHRGGAAGYFEDELGLSSADLKALRGLYLERA